MKKSIFVCFVFAVLTGCFSISQAQQAYPPGTNWITGTILRLEKMRDSLNTYIRLCDDEIQRCNATAIKSENMRQLAKEKGNAEVEKVANEALVRAKKALSINTERKYSAISNKRRLDLSITEMKNQYINLPEHSKKITSVIINYNGNINLKKKNGELINWGKEQHLFLDKGDEISTPSGSSIELVFLEGRGNVKIGENSTVMMDEDSAGTELMNISQGKVNIVVEKQENYSASMEASIAAYREDLEIAKDEFKQRLVDEYDRMKKAGIKLAKRKFRVIVPPGAVAVRGTQLLINEDRKTGTEVIVLEGSIEMKGKKGDRTIIVDAGYKGTISTDGVVTGPQMIDISKIDQWWK